MSTLPCHLLTRDPQAEPARYGSVLGAAEISRIAPPSGQVMTMELRLGGSRLAIADQFPDMGVVSHQTLGGTHAALPIAVEDADAVWDRAMRARGTVFEPLHDAFWRRRAVGPHIRDVAHDEVVGLAATAFGGGHGDE